MKFMDNGSFTTNYKSTGPSSLPQKCKLCGFTALRAGNKYDKELYINRSYASPSTVIHEMLHFLTHPLFWDFVPPEINEAVTEYFTRKVILNQPNDDEFDISQRQYNYPVHHQMLVLQRGDIKKQSRRPMPGYMKAAYFSGNSKAIAFVKAELKDLQEMLKHDQ